jgi:hypothetical protein
MERTNRYRGVGVLAAALVGLTGLAGPAPQAPPGGSPLRVAAASSHDTTPIKHATASCPLGSSVFAAGARIIDGDGAVVLTRMLPDPSLTSVTTTGVARTGHARDWSVQAYAICDRSTFPPWLAHTTVHSATTATATCPGAQLLVGTGFALDAVVDHNHLVEVTIGPGLRQVRVSTGGPGTPSRLTAVAICKQPSSPTGNHGVRLEATSAVDATWPKTVAVGDSVADRWIYGVGAAITGPADAFLTALVPHVDPDLAVATAARRNQPAFADGRASLAADESGSVSVYAAAIGTFH